MKRGKLFVISGPSGAGKGTICKEILKEEALNTKLSVSMTTRNPREGEVDGVHYFFADKEYFQKLVEQDGFLEYAEVYGNFYGTPKKQVMDWLDEGINVILEIDVQGARNVQLAYPEGIYIFILPPSLEELKERIIGRGSETEETLKRRLGAAVDEISSIYRYDYRVVNDNLDTAVEQVRSIMIAEQCAMDEQEVKNIVDSYKEDL